MTRSWFGRQPFDFVKSGVWRVLSGLLLFSGGLTAGDPGSGNQDIKVIGRMIRAGVAQVDSVSGQLYIQLPLGPTLPGRIPLEIVWKHEGDRPVGTPNSFIAPFVWPDLGETQQPRRINVTLNYSEMGFYPSTRATISEAVGWLRDRHVSDPTWVVGKSNLRKTVKLFTSVDGASHLVVSRWETMKSMPDGSVVSIGEAALQEVVVSGDTATYVEIPNTIEGTTTTISNRWGDWVKVTQEGTPLSHLLIENNLGHQVELLATQLTNNTTVPGEFSGEGTYTVTNNFGIATVTVTADVRTSPTSILAQLNPVDTNLIIKTIADPIRGTNLTFSTDLSTITHASGAKYEFIRGVELTPAGNQAAEGFSSVDNPGGLIQKGDWKGWEPVQYSASDYEIGERRKAIERIRVTSLTPGEGGQRIEFRRKIPTPSGYNSSAQTITWAGGDTSTSTEIRIYPNPDATSGEVCRFNRLIHAEPGSYYGSPSQSVSLQRQMLLFAYGAVVREESGTIEAGGEIVRSITTYDGWSLRSFLNPDGVIAGAKSLHPVATRKVVSRPLKDGPMEAQERLNWDGIAFTQARSVVLPPGSGLTGWDSSGLPRAAKWRGSEIPDSVTLAGSVERTRDTTIQWNPIIPFLGSQSEGNQVGGSEYLLLRGASSADLGTQTTTRDNFGRITKVEGRTGQYISTMVRVPVEGGPETSSTTRSLTGPGAEIPLSGRVGETYTYSGVWRSSVTQRPDVRPTLEGRDGIGRITSTTSPDGVVVSTEYDSLGRLWRTTRLAKGVVGSETTWVEWDPAGRWQRQHSKGNNGSDLINEVVFDAFGRQVATISAKGTPAERKIIYQYDGFGQKLKESLPTKVGVTPRYFEWKFEPDGFLKSTLNSKGITTATFSRPVLGALGGATVFIHAVQGVRGLPRKTWVDLLGQTIQQQDAKGQLATMKFDSYGRLIEARRGNQVRSYTYNTVGWLMSQTQPEEGSTVFSGHTISGMPLTTTKGSGAASTTITTSLFQVADGGNREGLPKQVNATGLGTAVTRVLNYDNSRRPTSLIESQGNGSVSETYTYDDLGRLTVKTISDGTVGFTISREFDDFGKVSKLNYPVGFGKTARAMIPQYDAHHRLLSVGFGGTSVLSSMAYDQIINGEEGERLTYANGVTTSWQRNLDHELSRVIHSAKASSGAPLSSVEDAAVIWSSDGLMTKRGGDTFDYDDLGRLRQSTVLGVTGEKIQQIFGYDFYGNRNSVQSLALIGGFPQEVVGYEFSVGTNNRLPSQTNAGVATGVQYDGLGRMTHIWAIPGNASALTQWNYDALGRVNSQAGSTAWTEAYLLDGMGLRFKRVKGDGTVQYTVYGFDREPLSVFEKATSQTSSLVASTSTKVSAQKSSPSLLAEGVGAWIVAPSGPITVQTGQTISFAGDTISGNSFTWLFGDGATASGLNTSHAYATGGSFTVKFTAKRTGYTSSSATVVITVVAPKPSISAFLATPTTITKGQSSDLTWSVVGGTNLSINGASVTGTKLTVTPASTTTYTLTATNASGSTTASVTVGVNAAIPPPVISGFTANPSTILQGQSSTLLWGVTGATSLSINQGIGSVGGSSLVVTPGTTTTYTLTASNGTGSVTANAIVTVNPPPPLTWKSDCVYAFGQLVMEDRGGVRVYQQGDHLGTPSVLTGANGVVVGRQKSLPFGERFPGSGEKSLRRFTNHEDGAQYPVYMQARMYLPTYGRFAQVDPAYDQAAMDPESWNLYAYCTNNPVTKTDPDGMREVSRDADLRSPWKTEWDWIRAWGFDDSVNERFQLQDAMADAYIERSKRDPEDRGIGDGFELSPYPGGGLIASPTAQEGTAQTNTGGGITFAAGFQVTLPANVPGIMGTPGAGGSGYPWSDHDFQLYVDHAMKDGELSALVKTLGNPSIASGPLSVNVKGAYANGSITIDTRKIAQNTTIGFQEFVKVLSHELRHGLQNKLVNSAGSVDLGISRDPSSGQVTFQRFNKQQFNQFTSAADSAYKQGDYRSYAMSPPEIDARIYAEWRSREARW